MSAEPPGANCALGGLRVDTGLDSNGDGVLEADEVQHTAYVCAAASGGGAGGAPADAGVDRPPASGGGAGTDSAAGGTGGAAGSDGGGGAITCESSPGALIDIGATLGGSRSMAVGIDDRGDVLANGALCAGCSPSQAFFWHAGTVIPLTGTLGTLQGIAMNRNGRAVGEVSANCSTISGCLVAWDAPSPDPTPFVSMGMDAVDLRGVGDNDAPFAWANTHRGCGQQCYNSIIWPPTLGNTATTLATIDGVSTTVNTVSAVNSLGQVVGASGGHAVLWTPSIRDLGNLGAGGAAAADINDATQVVGTSSTASGSSHAFLWQAGVMQDLGTLQGGSSQAITINGAGDVAGNSDGHAFVWRGGSMIDLGTLGGPSSTAIAMNDAGQVTGNSQTAAGDTHPFLWQGGVMTDLGTLGGASSTATAINVAGLVVGTSTTANGDLHAFLACSGLSAGGTGGTGGQGGAGGTAGSGGQPGGATGGMVGGGGQTGGGGAGGTGGAGGMAGSGGGTARVVALSAGDAHTCALLASGEIKCWGSNLYGQLGLGDLNTRGNGPGQMGDALPAVDLGTGRTALAVSAGAWDTCALLDNHQIKCWGRADVLGIGQNAGTRFVPNYIGDSPGEMGDALPFVDLGTGRSALTVATGADHTCALLDNRQVKCWGNGPFGQLGLGDTTSRGLQPGQMGDNLPFVALGTGRTVMTLISSWYQNCVLLDDQELKCWGENNYGQLGLGDTNNRGDQAGEMGDALSAVSIGTGRIVQAVSSRGSFTCALLDNGQVKCWGYNNDGELGLGDTATRGGMPGQMGDALATVALGTGRTARAVAAAGDHSCALLDDGSLKCWGQNAYGGLGTGDLVARGNLPGQMGDTLPAVNLGSNRTAQAVATGSGFTCALLDDSSVKCWGTGGLLGLGDATSRGGHPGDMGDSLPTVNLGAGP